jgi:hypothetical protein
MASKDQKTFPTKPIIEVLDDIKISDLKSMLENCKKESVPRFDPTQYFQDKSKEYVSSCSPFFGCNVQMQISV